MFSSKDDLANIPQPELFVPVDETKHDYHFDQEKLKGKLDESVSVAWQEVPYQELSRSGDHEGDLGDEDWADAKEKRKHG